MPHNVAIYYTPDAIIGSCAIIGIATCDTGTGRCLAAFVSPDQARRIGEFFGHESVVETVENLRSDAVHWKAGYVMTRYLTDYPTSVYYGQPMGSIREFNDCFDAAVKRYLTQ